MTRVNRSGKRMYVDVVDRINFLCSWELENGGLGSNKYNVDVVKG